MMTRIRTLIDKEWAEVFKNRLVLMTVIILPLVFTILPLVILGATKSSAATTTDVPPGFFQACGNLSAGDCLQYFLVNEFLLMFMIMPMAIPIAIAAYSVVGEKATHSLEPLLATPVTTEELLAAKGLAAVIPAIAATWAGFAVFVALGPLAGMSPAVYAHVLSPTWLVAIIVVGPLIAVMATNFALMVSSRVSDPRAAEQISAVLIIPFVGLIFGQIAGVITLNLQTIMVTVVVLALIDVALVYLGARLFQRETILTKWK